MNKTSNIEDQIMYENLIRSTERFGAASILLVGDFMLDRYVWGDIERISPEAPVPIMKALRSESRPGGAGLVAANIQSLGAKAVCVGVVGYDAAGTELNQQLSLTGANTKNLMSLSKRPTTVKERFIGLAQCRHGQQLLRIDREDNSSLSAQIQDGLLASINKLLPEVEAVCLEDYGKGVLSVNICRQIIKLAKKAGKLILVDPYRTSDFSKYTGANVITPNRLEASLASGVEISDRESIFKTAEKLMQIGQFGAVVITLDQMGSYLLQKGQQGRLISTRQREVYDVAGAGDVVLATLSVALSSGLKLSEAVVLANIGGGLAVEKFTSSIVSREEILNALLANHVGHPTKLHTAEQLDQELEKYRHNNKTIVFTNGCFDVLHMGHVSLLAKARAMGDVLIVGLNSDESIRAIKGSGRPVCTQEQRATVLASLESVDYVIIFNETEPLELLKKLRPDLLVKGQDYIDRKVVGREFVEEYGGQVQLIPMISGCSTTNMIRTILDRFPKEYSENKEKG